MIFSKSSLTLFSFLSFFSILSTIIQPVVIAYLLVHPQPIHAQESGTLELNYNQNNHILSLGSTHTYSLYYQTESSTEAVFGTGSTIFVGSASTDGISPDNLLRGILKINSDTYYFVVDNQDIEIVLALPTLSKEITAAEQGWLLNPNTYADLRTGVIYSAPFNPDFSLTFDTLPSNPGSITFNQITLTKEQIAQSGALDEVAYEVTSSMTDGTFSYSLTLPNPTDTQSVAIQYSEDGANFYPITEVAATNSEVTVSELDHFTIFVITGIQNSPGVRINEFVYNPSSGSEWIELYNTETTEVDLTNWRLSDTSLNYVVLSGTIPAMGYKLVNVNFLNNTGSSSSTETITLSYPILNIVDRLTYTRSLLLGILLGGDLVSSDNIMQDKSIGRSPDGGSDWTSYDTPTPGYTNLGDSTPPVIHYSLSHPANAHGWHNTDVTVTWIVNEPESPYTTDGCDPTIVTAEDATTLTCSATSAGGPSSMSVTIKLDKSRPIAPTISYPAEAQYFKTTPISNEWTTISDISGIEQYRIEYVYDDGHSFYDAPYRYTTTNSRSHAPGITEQGGVRFRVQAIDNAGNYGDWSGWRHYYYDATPPSVPVLTWPINNLFTNDNTPFMQWEDSIDTYGVAGYLYRVYYNCSDPSSLATCLSIYPNTTGLWRTTSELQAGTTSDGTYLWQVRSQDNAGNQSDWSEAEQVTIDTIAPSTPSIISPIDGFITKGVAFSQSWGLVPGAISYDYESCNVDPGDISTVCSSPKFTSSYSSPTKLVTAGQPNSHFWWRVRARDAAGNISSWSESRELIIDNTAPTLVDQTEYSGWYNTPQLSEFTYTDAYGIASGNPASCTIATEGTSQTCSVTPNVVDNAGNTNTTLVTSHPANLDWSDPDSTITSPVNLGDNTVLITNAWDGIIEGTASDSISDVASVSLSIKRESDNLYWNGTDWVVGTELATRVLAAGTNSWSYDLGFVPTEDTYTLTSHATDLATNTEDSYQLTIILDKTIPEVGISLSPTTPDGSNSWYLTKPVVTLTATDSHIDSIEYQWDSQTGLWTSYSAPFDIVGEGSHTLYYRAHDTAGNTSDVGVKTIRYDQTELEEGPQNVAVNPNPTSGTVSTVSWDPALDNIGIDYYEIQWKLGGTTYTKNLGSNETELEIDQLTEGEWDIIVRAYDSAGHNKSASTTLTVDRTPPSSPTLTLTSTGVGTASLSWSSVAGATSYLIWYGTSTGIYPFAANVGNINSYTVQGLGAGSYYFVVQATDAVSNGSPFSNEVNTGNITGAPGVAPETPAEGFAPAVLGDETAAQNESTQITPEQIEGSVLGESESYFNYWWLLLFLLIILYAIYRYLRSHNKQLSFLASTIALIWGLYPDVILLKQTLAVTTLL